MPARTSNLLEIVSKLIVPSVGGVLLQDLAVASDGLRLPGLQIEIPKYVFGPYSNRPLQESAKLVVDCFYKDHDDASCSLARITHIQQ